MAALDYAGTVTLPDGRKVEGVVKGYTERDTGAWVTTSLYLAWPDGRMLAATDENSILPNGDPLWFWVETELLKLEPSDPFDGDLWW